MSRYAREDTHYLLYIYDLMRLRLLNESSGENDLLLEVIFCSSSPPPFFACLMVMFFDCTAQYTLPIPAINSMQHLNPLSFLQFF
jgi:hypothetical protein